MTTGGGDAAEAPEAAGCHAHPKVAAVATCRGCFKPLCETCAINDSKLVPRCAACMQKKARRDLVLLGVGALVAVFAVVGGMRYWKRIRAAEAAEQAAQANKPNYGIHGELIAKLAARLQKEPCDRDAIVQLGESLMRAGDPRATLTNSVRFLGKCGEHPRLRFLAYAAHKQLSEWEPAAEQATKLIEFDPYDADYRGWRGLMYERKGDLVRAVEDYRQALMLRPSMVDLPLNLADAHVKLGQPCDAILPLAQAVALHPNATNAHAVKVRIAELAAMPQCAWAAGEGQAKVKAEAGSGMMIVKARIDGGDAGEFIVDTGATLVVLARRFANHIGLDTRDAPALLTQTANGVAKGSAVVLDKVEVQGLTAVRVKAAVLDDLGDIDGLLGMSFLSRFDLRHSAGVLEITARSSKP